MKFIKSAIFITMLFVFAVAGFSVVNAQTSVPNISYISPTSIEAGVQVTIYGSNLYGNILIIDGELSPSWQYNSTLDSTGNTMIFNAPSSVGSHSIQIEQRIVGGRSNSATLNVVATLPTISRIDPATARVGDTITVFGTNLYGNTVVFDGVQLSTYMTTYGQSDTSGNSITFTVPSTASVSSHTIQIERRIIGGLSNSVSLNVVAPLQLPTISYINPTSTGAGGQVTIYGSNLYGNILVIDGEVAPTWQSNSTIDSTGKTMIFNAPSNVGNHNIQVEQRIVGGRSNTVTLNVITPVVSSGTSQISNTSNTSNQTTQQLQQMIQFLLDQIKTLQNRLAQTQSSQSGSSGQSDNAPTSSYNSCLILSNNFGYRSRDAYTNGEVSALQDFLQTKGFLSSEPSGFFGLLTLGAVKSFQIANSIDQTGYVGPLTRAKINSLSCQ